MLVAAQHPWVKGTTSSKQGTFPFDFAVPVFSPGEMCAHFGQQFAARQVG